ncbi:MAG: hypothetical protein H6922_06525 [Pseudomonadaceae bacterium]|nr:hypothetical protein [Pseudomonadaceae bacterium]
MTDYPQVPPTRAELVRMNLEQLIAIMPDRRRNIIMRIYKDHQDLFDTNPGSSHNHQAWPGGLADHYADLLRTSWTDYADELAWAEAYNAELPFTLGPAQVALFGHDAEKVVVYGKKDDPRCAPFIAMHEAPSDKATKEGIKWHVLKHWENTYGLVLDDAEINAVKYTHGEGDDYRNDRRIMNELAAFVGNCDRGSARIRHRMGRGLGVFPPCRFDARYLLRRKVKLNFPHERNRPSGGFFKAFA